MVFIKTVLILEDNLLALGKIMEKLALVEQEQPYDVATIQLSSAKQVEDYINSNPKAAFDVILLDGDCKINQSFHIFNIERFGPEKVIAISSVPKWNEEAQKRGVQKVIEKDFFHLDDFAQRVAKEVQHMLNQTPLV